MVQPGMKMNLYLIFGLILGWTALTLGVVWIPFTRCLLEGNSYRWDFGLFSGSGINGDFWILLCWILGVLALQFMGLRKRHLRLTQIGLLFSVTFLLAISLIFFMEDTKFGGGRNASQWVLEFFMDPLSFHFNPINFLPRISFFYWSSLSWCPPRPSFSTKVLRTVPWIR